jgi:hypothetical protein
MYKLIKNNGKLILQHRELKLKKSECILLTIVFILILLSGM